MKIKQIIMGASAIVMAHNVSLAVPYYCRECRTQHQSLSACEHFDFEKYVRDYADSLRNSNNQGAVRFEALAKAVQKKMEILSYRETEASHQEFLDQINTAQAAQEVLRYMGLPY